MSTSDDRVEQTEQGWGGGSGTGAASLISESVDSCGEDRGRGGGVLWRVKDEIETSARGRCGAHEGPRGEAKARAGRAARARACGAEEG